MSFWEGKRVLVTGHTGFKGTWLLMYLKRLGAEITGYSLNPSTSPSMYHLLNTGRSIDDRRGDIRHLNNLISVMKECKPEIVFHLAAQPLVRESYRRPVKTYAVNVMGTVNLLEAIRRVGGVKAAVVVTTDKCYANSGERRAFVEDDPLGGADPYSSSKGAAEIVAAAYRESYFAPTKYNNSHCTVLSTARAGNVIGGGDWSADRLVPDIVRALTSRKKLHVRMPDAVRPWQHVLDALRGYLLLAECMFCKDIAYSGSWNFGPEASDVLSVADVIDLFFAAWDVEKETEIRSSRISEADFLALDSSKAKQYLSWQSLLCTHDAVRLTVDWYKSWTEEHDLNKVTLQQIDYFIDRHYKGI